MLVWLCSSLSITFKRNPPAIHYVVGEIAESNVYSEIAFQYQDPEATRQLREQTAAAVPPVYRISQAAVLATMDGLKSAGDTLRALPAEPATPKTRGEKKPPPKTETETGVLSGLTPQARDTLIGIAGSPETWQALHDLLEDSVNAGIADPEDVATLQLSGSPTQSIYLLNENRKSLIQIPDLKTPQQAAARIANAFAARFGNTRKGSSQALQTMLTNLIKPNMVYNTDATEKARRDAAAAVKPVLHFVGANELLLRRGHKVTDEDLIRLQKHQQELHSQEKIYHSPLRQFLAPILCALILLAAARCLYIYKGDVYRQTGTIVLISLTAVLQILLARTVSSFYILSTGSSFFLFSMLPLSFAAMLLSPLVGLRVTLCVAGYTSLVAALQGDTPHSFQLFLLGALSSFAAGTLMRHARRRSHVLFTGLGAGGTVFLVQLVFAMRGNIPLDTALRVLPVMLGYAFVNGVAVAMVVSFLLPIFEYAFGLTTAISLLELSDLNHPLLKRLQVEAPGTYYHSLMVATLAERAAAAIGANPLLARACAYFHDIGKLAHPEYFAENKQGYDPHEGLQPRMSSLVILNHVKEGIDLAQTAKLKRPIRDAIAQHHGTDLVYYFYHRAKSQTDPDQAGSAVGEHDYRYPGPRPRSKETVLISIADACEAAVRSLEKPVPQKIQALVDEIVLKRIRDHQLDDADMTFAELAKARDTIVSTLGMMYHGRVQYPKESQDETDLFQAAARAAARKQEADAESAPQSDEPERTE